jgi:hypothetical protein
MKKKIKKWIPKNGERFFSVALGTWELVVVECQCSHIHSDPMNCFKTSEEALAAAKEIEQILGCNKIKGVK